jgi:hypothetical protein
LTRPDRFIPWLDDGRWERIVLLAALVHGILYLAVVPPWQHYDEPTHFEYAWLIAERGTLPQSGDYDQAMRREVAASMVEHGFFRDLGLRPNLLLEHEPIWIGVSELEHPPFYYLLASLPLRLIRYSDVSVQLYAVRGISLALYLLSVWLGGRIVAELVGKDHILRWAVPAMMALLPAYTDLMTAVNSDVGAVAVFSLFLWGAVRMIVRGFSWSRLAWVAGTAALCGWTKNTVWVAVPLALLALVLALGRGHLRRPIWAGFLALGLAAVVSVVDWGDAAYWYRETGQVGVTQQKKERAPLGDAVLALEAAAGHPEGSVRQPLVNAEVKALRGQTVTLGAWIWASQPVQIRSPVLYDGLQTTWERLDVGDAPAFYTITATVAAEAEQVHVILRPSPGQTGEEDTTVYYDGVVLAEGAHSPHEPPVFDGPDAKEGTWAGEPVTNRVRNGSAEASWPRMRPWVERELQPVLPRLPAAPYQLLGLLDWAYAGRAYTAALVNVFQSFWARFGWNHVGLGPAWYWILSGWTAIGVIGAGVGAGRFRGKDAPSVVQAVALLTMAGLLVWGLCFLRTDILAFFLPGARYAFPAIVPTALALMAGWLAWVPWRARGWAALGLLLGMILLDAASLITIRTFYS